LTGLTVGTSSTRDAELLFTGSPGPISLSRHFQHHFQWRRRVAPGRKRCTLLDGQIPLARATKKETGILAVEAATNSIIVGEVLKAATQARSSYRRQFQGRVLQQFVDLELILSFDSLFDCLVDCQRFLAHEYPGPLTQVLAYGCRYRR